MLLLEPHPTRGAFPPHAQLSMMRDPQRPNSRMDNQAPVLAVEVAKGLGCTPPDRRFNQSIFDCMLSTIVHRKRVKADRESESRISLNEDVPNVNDGSRTKLPGQLEMDQGLWDHIQHVLTNIKPLPSTTQQLQELAKYNISSCTRMNLECNLYRYVASYLGGPVERSGPLCFELPAGQKQQERQSNLLPLGEVYRGSFQHRALLYKVSRLVQCL